MTTTVAAVVLSLGLVGLYAGFMHLLGRLALVWVRHYRGHRKTQAVAAHLRTTFGVPVYTRSFAQMYAVGALIPAGAIGATWWLPVMLDTLRTWLTP